MQDLPSLQCNQDEKMLSPLKDCMCPSHYPVASRDTLLEYETHTAHPFVLQTRVVPQVVSAWVKQKSN